MTYYTIQAKCTGMGWVNTKYHASTPDEAEQQRAKLLENDAAWMPDSPRGKREARIYNCQTEKPLS